VITSPIRNRVGIHASEDDTPPSETISEAGMNSDCRPHVLRSGRSKFSDITPRSSAAAVDVSYRPEDIEFLRGIKTLLQHEKHPIKDVQKANREEARASRIIEIRAISRREASRGAVTYRTRNWSLKRIEKRLRPSICVL